MAAYLTDGREWQAPTQEPAILVYRVFFANSNTPKVICVTAS